MSAGAVEFRVARTPVDKDGVLALRDQVYVRDQARLADVADTAATFDRFDRQSTYILACQDAEPVGTIKVVPDSEIGLPCEDMISLASLRSGERARRLVEFGHLMTVPRARNRQIGIGLMRAALVHSLTEHAATHVLGDFFAEDDGSLRGFYTQIGFVPVGEPYRDTRFQHAPLSVIAVLDLEDAAARTRTPAEADNAPLQYFFHDYDRHLRTARPARAAS